MNGPSPFVRIEGQDGRRLFVREDCLPHLQKAGLSSFADWMALALPFREVSMRPQRPVVALDIKGIPRQIFLKRNLDAPRAESILEKFGLRAILSEAEKEHRKLQAFTQAGIHVPETIAWGEGDWKGTANASFIASLDLESQPLERYLFRSWKLPIDSDSARDKRILIRETALLARRMHRAGLVHRDFYFGHIFVSPPDEKGAHPLSVIDVQRASHRPAWWLRSQIKDLASLHFSADPAYFRCIDRIRFLHAYFGVQHLNCLHKALMALIERKFQRIRRHTEKSLGIPYSDFFKNKYY